MIFLTDLILLIPVSERLQKSYNEESGFDKDEVTNDIIMKVFVAAGIPTEKISSELKTTFINELRSNGLVTSKDILKKDHENKFEEMEFSDEILVEHATKIKEEFVKQMKKKGSKKITIENGDLEPVKNKMQSYVSEKDFKELILELNSRLSHKTVYKVNVDKDKFVSECIKSINELLKYKDISEVIQQSVGMHYIDENNKAQYEKAKETTAKYGSMDIGIRSYFEIVNYVMGGTDLPRLIIQQILKGIEKRRLLDSQDYLDDVMLLIKKIFLKHQAKPSISYEILHGYKFDSKGELKFAEFLDDDRNVLLFTKIKKGGFVIATPYGNYSPDWAIAYRNTEGKAELYFIVETKMDKEWEDLSDVEQFKIHCGMAHFETIAKNSKQDVKFNWANSYGDFKEKFGLESQF